MEPVRQALIVATDTFEDSKLSSLRAPARDAEELARVLGNPEIGDFEVQASLNEPDHVVRRKLSAFFRERGRDDLLLLHVSSHGLKDEDGTLYFATTNTDVNDLEATAIPSEFVNRLMSRSRSHRMVLLLDCCFGGAFARGFVHRGGEGVDVAEKFDGRGRVVLTASRAMEWAFEGEQLSGEARPSIFTASIVEGLETGRADRDQDSRISVDELYDYVYDQVRDATPNQTPSKWTFDVQGELFLARSSYRAEIEPAELPLELRAAIESPLPRVRAGAVEDLAQLNRGTHPGLALSARLALEQLLDDDSRSVAEAAAQTLQLPPDARVVAPVGESSQASELAAGSLELTPDPQDATQAGNLAPVVEAPADDRTSGPAPISAAVAPARKLRLPTTTSLAGRWSIALALVGAALLALGYVVDTGQGGSQLDLALEFLDPGDHSPTWFVWSPIEAFGVALLAAAVVLVGPVVGLAREAANGILIGVGLLSGAGSLALLRTDYDLVPAVLLTVLGSLGILGAGVYGAVTDRPAELEESPRWALWASGIGTCLLVAVLFLNFASPSTNTLLIYENVGLTHLAAMGAQFWVELVVAAGVAAVATALAYRQRQARLLAGGLLIAVGAQVALHISGLLFQLWKFDKNEEHTWRLGGLVGLLTAALLLAAGSAVLRAGKVPDRD